MTDRTPGEAEPPDSYDLETEAEVTCPHCGEIVEISLDPGGGTHQEYVEDCEVCCKPWVVRLVYDEAGRATVSLEPAS